MIAFALLLKYFIIYAKEPRISNILTYEHGKQKVFILIQIVNAEY
jgi:hypothetical protein